MYIELFLDSVNTVLQPKWPDYKCEYACFFKRFSSSPIGESTPSFENKDGQDVTSSLQVPVPEFNTKEQEQVEQMPDTDFSGLETDFPCLSRK